MEKGDRVRLSGLAKRINICRSNPDRRGVFAGLEKGVWVKVLWDGNKSVGTGYHPDFIEADTMPVTNGDKR